MTEEQEKALDLVKVETARLREALNAANDAGVPTLEIMRLMQQAMMPPTPSPR